MATAAGFRSALLKLPTPGSGLDDEDRYALGGCPLAAGATGTDPVIGSTLASKQRGAVGHVILPDDSLNDVQARYHIARVIYPDPSNTEAFQESFDVSYELRSAFSESLAPTSNTVVLDGVLNAFTSNFEVGKPVKKAGSGKGHRYFINLGDQRVEVDSVEHGQQLLEEYDRQINKPKRIRKVITDSVSLDLTEVPFKSRQRLVQRSRDVDKPLPERTRFAVRDAPKKQGDSIPERKRFVTRDSTPSQDNIPDRPRFIQKKTKSEDPLMKILRKRNK